MKTKLMKVTAMAMMAILPMTSQLQPAVGTVNPPLTVSISGTVTLPDGGLPVPGGTRVWLHRPDDENLDFDVDVNGLSQVIPDTGAFTFAGVPRGNYLLRAVPADQPPYAVAPGIVTPLQVGGTSISAVSLKLADPLAVGHILKPDGVTAVRGIAHVYWNGVEVERRWTQSGQFTIGGLPPVGVVIRAEAWPGDGLWWSLPAALTLVNGTTQSVTLALTNPQIKGTVYESPINPNPVAFAEVSAYESVVGVRTDRSGANGKYAIGGLAPGLAMVTLEAPFGLSWLEDPAPVAVNVPSIGSINVPITFSLPNKTVHGLVLTNDGNPVSGALIQSYRIDRRGYNAALTTSSGAYSMTLSQGLWEVRAQPISTTIPPHWFDPSETRSVRFEFNPAPDDKTINFRALIADGAATGLVLLPGGGAPAFAVSVALHNDEGIGAHSMLDVNGMYTVTVPHGTYRMDLRMSGSTYAPPALPLVHVGAITPTMVPSITLLARDAIITGTLTDATNAPVADVPVVAWNAATHAAFHARTGPDGGYDLAVYSGTWSVRPAVLASQPYIYTGTATSVVAQSNATSQNVDFTLVNASSTLHGVLLDAAGSLLADATGWAHANVIAGGISNGAPIRHGQFDIQVPSGSYSVTLRLPNGSKYLWGGAAIVSTAPGSISFTLVRKDALIYGALIDKRTGVSPADVDARVWAWDDGMSTGTDVRESGLYSLPVSAGEWGVNYALGDERDDYVKVAGARTVAVQAGQRERLGLPVVKKDALLTGTVALPNGDPARGAWVTAETTSADIFGVTLRTAVKDDGTFSLRLPHGRFNLHSSLPSQPALINPRMRSVVLPPHGFATVALHYRQPDAILKGMVSLPGGVPLSGEATLWAFSDDDSFNTVRVTASGDYTLPLISGMVYTVVARLETASSWWTTRTTALVDNDTTLNLQLVGPKARPGPVSIMFDSASDADAVLADGTRVHVPAGAMPVTGNVILHATPLVNTHFNRFGDVEGMSYAFEAFSEDGQPITTNFNADVSITFPYDPARLEHRGLRLNHLVPAYFSTTTNQWTRPDSFVNDLTHHAITLQINHFTEYALVATTGDAGGLVFLPVVAR